MSQAEIAPQSIADEFCADLEAGQSEAALEHELVADLRAILEGPNGHTIGSLARVVEQLLAELSLAQPLIAGAGAGQTDIELSTNQIEELGSVLLEFERRHTEDATA